MKLSTLRFFQQREEQSLPDLTASNAAVMLGISRREFMQDVSDLNRDGVLILSHGDGFAIRKDPQEIARCCAKLKSTAISILDRLAAINKTTREFEAKQLSLEL